MRKPLTTTLNETEQKIYDLIIEGYTTGIIPSVRELGKVMGFKSTSTIHNYLLTLQKKGYVTKREGKNRGVIPIAAPKIILLPVFSSNLNNLQIIDTVSFIPKRPMKKEDLVAYKIYDDKDFMKKQICVDDVIIINIDPEYPIHSVDGISCYVYENTLNLTPPKQESEHKEYGRIIQVIKTLSI